MSIIYDFWLGEQLAMTTRYAKRHKRDGLCYDCAKVAVSGRARCQEHHERNKAAKSAALVRQRLLREHGCSRLKAQDHARVWMDKGSPTRFGGELGPLGPGRRRDVGVA